MIEKIKGLNNNIFGTIGSCWHQWEGNSLREISMSLLTERCANNNELMELLGRWRKENEFWFAATFPVSLEGTRKWFIEQVINQSRLLFLITSNGKPIGHVGLFRFNFETGFCEIDNIVRGEPDVKGLMETAIKEMMQWGRNNLDIKQYGLQTASDNERALRLYERLGFIETKREPMILVEKGNRKEWQPTTETDNIKRYTVFMELKNEKN